MATFRKIQIAITFLWATSIGHAYGDYSNLPGGRGFDDSCCCESTCCGKGFISADLLYWRAFEDGLDECFPQEDFDYISSDGRVETNFRGKGKDPSFNWDPGFRIGLGYQFGCGWDIALFWTDFHSRSNRNHGNEYSYGYSKGYSYGDTTHPRHWKLDFDVVDIVAGREFNWGSCFSWRPFGGLRGARIEQKLSAKFAGADYAYTELSTYDFSFEVIPSNGSSGNFAFSDERGKQRFLGIGPLVGIEGDWNLGCGFSIYANASFAILYGNFHIRLNEADSFSNGAEYCRVKKNLNACQTVLDAGFGIRWETCFCSNIVWVQLGLEHHQYFNQNRLGGYGDLCLDGANLSAGIAF